MCSAPPASIARFAALGPELRFLLITSQAQVHAAAAAPDEAVAAAGIGNSGVWIVVQPSSDAKCVRCWQHRPDVGADGRHPELCARCVSNLRAPGEQRSTHERCGRRAGAGARAPPLRARRGSCPLRPAVGAGCRSRRWSSWPIRPRRRGSCSTFPCSSACACCRCWRSRAYNTGAAFSFLADAAGWQRWLFVLLALVVSVALLVWLRRLQAAAHALLACGVALILGGALGNMIDRLARPG